MIIIVQVQHTGSMGNIMDDGDEQTTSLDRLNANIAKMEELTQRLMAALSRRRWPPFRGAGCTIRDCRARDTTYI